MKHRVCPVSTYVWVFLALMLGTFLTVYVAFIDLGPLNIAVALAIAGAKTFLVLTFFMHLKWAARINWMCAGVSVLFLAALIAFVAADVEGRDWQYRAQAWDQAPAAPAARHP
jgi:cytochrome c oxidase subunit 4